MRKVSVKNPARFLSLSLLALQSGKIRLELAFRRQAVVRVAERSKVAENTFADSRGYF